MSDSSEQPPRQSSWAQPIKRLRVSDQQDGAVNLNVEGRKVTGPIQGFGQMWKKTYTIRLAGSPVSPQELIQGWKDNFSTFWPAGNRFYNRSASIVPGQVALLNLSGPGEINPPGGGPLISTGVVVVYADDLSFSFMTPEGHMFAGIITFSAFHENDTVAQIQALVRASDPMYELTFRLGFGHKMEDEFWMQTLQNLAVHYKASGSHPEMNRVVVDPRMQWNKARNIWQNAAIRTSFYTLAAPARWLKSRFHNE